MIKRFSQISNKDINSCGGKGSSLGEMTQAGFTVPNGFVLTTKAFGLNSHERDNEVLHAFDQLDCKFVAVRSSGTKEDGVDDSFAGQFDTYLFVTKEKLIEQIIECHKSVDSDRIKTYCESKNINRKDIKVAVVVQKMVNSDVAGVCFTVNPVTGENNEVMIEAGYGVGEAIVSGMITPDNYIVDKITGSIQKNISEQKKKLVLNIEQGGTKEEKVEPTISNIQKLSDKHILELAEYAKNIEKHYEKPMDTEWAVEDGKLYILQARPVTKLGNTNEANQTDKEQVLKGYTRDASLILQQSWFDCLYSPSYSLKTSPYKNLVIDYMLDGAIEIWINPNAISWVRNELLDTIYNKPDIYDELLNKHEENLEVLQEWKIRGFKSKNELSEFAKFVYVAIKIFDAMYFATYEEKLPTRFSNRINKMRKEDSFMDTTDKLIRNGLLQFYPHIKGYEQCVLVSEITEIPPLEILKKRRDNFVVIGELQAEIITIDDFATNHNIKLFRDTYHIDDKQEILGTKGNGGLQKGYVKILRRKDQIGEVKKGDIIVSPMTTPDFLPAMEKAAAFITDEGGVTCHAAIIARELNKPCIIGTKVATQVLKNGDLVEVNADNGVVKILSN